MGGRIYEEPSMEEDELYFLEDEFNRKIYDSKIVQLSKYVLNKLDEIDFNYIPGTNQ